MDPKNLYRKSKNAAYHVYHRRGRYAATATLVATVVVFNKIDRVSEWNEFLEKKGLFEEFYTPELLEV